MIVKYVVRAGTSPAGFDVVFRDPDGHVVASAKTDAAGEARQFLPAGAGVTLVGLVMDGDLPTVAFTTTVGGGQRGFVVRLDEVPVDLGNFDADATTAVSAPVLTVPHADQPIVAWVDPTSGAPDGPQVVRVSERGATGWSAIGAPVPVPHGRQFSSTPPPMAFVWDAAGDRPIVAAPVRDADLVQVWAGGDPLCAGLVDVDEADFAGSVVGIGLAVDPTGGFVVATAHASDDFAPHISVERVRP